MPTEKPWYAPGYVKPSIPRRRAVGEAIWRLRYEDGRVQTCEIRDDSALGAGFDVLISLNDEPQFSRRCVDRAEADYVARALRQDAERGGWEPIGS